MNAHPGSASLPPASSQSSDEILAATSSTGGDGSGQPGSTAAPSSATGGSGASGGASAALSFGAIKAEKLQTVGLAVPVAVAGAASGFGGAASMLTAEERVGLLAASLGAAVAPVSDRSAPAGVFPFRTSPSTSLRALASRLLAGLLRCSGVASTWAIWVASSMSSPRFVCVGD